MFMAVRVSILLSTSAIFASARVRTSPRFCFLRELTQIDYKPLIIHFADERRRRHNRLGYAVQLCLLRLPAPALPWSPIYFSTPPGPTISWLDFHASNSCKTSSNLLFSAIVRSLSFTADAIHNMFIPSDRMVTRTQFFLLVHS